MRSVRVRFPALASLLALSLTTSAASGDAVESWMRKGEAFADQLKTSAALAAFLEADRLQPNDTVILAKVAEQYGLSMDDVSSRKAKKAAGEKALEFARRAVQADGENGNAHLALSISYGRLALLEDNKTKLTYSRLVREEAEKAVALNPADDLAHHVLGSWHYELANLNGLLRALAQAIYGKLPAASNEAAVRHFQQAVAIAPQRIRHHVELGRTYAAQGQKDLARAELQRALALPVREKDDPKSQALARSTLRGL